LGQEAGALLLFMMLPISCAIVIIITSTTSRHRLQKKKHPGVIIPVPAAIFPAPCKNNSSCKNTVAGPVTSIALTHAAAAAAAHGSLQGSM
jgi:hypothetical protein